MTSGGERLEDFVRAALGLRDLLTEEPRAEASVPDRLRRLERCLARLHVAVLELEQVSVAGVEVTSLSAWNEVETRAAAKRYCASLPEDCIGFWTALEPWKLESDGLGFLDVDWALENVVSWLDAGMNALREGDGRTAASLWCDLYRGALGRYLRDLLSALGAREEASAG